MGIVLPDGYFGAATLTAKMANQRIEGFDHMAVTQIP
jgi:hypothetical protein